MLEGWWATFEEQKLHPEAGENQYADVGSWVMSARSLNHCDHFIKAADTMLTVPRCYQAADAVQMRELRFTNLDRVTWLSGR